MINFRVDRSFFSGGSFDRRKILCRLPAFEQTVIAHVADATMAKFGDTREVVWRPASRVIRVLPGREQQHLAGISNALEHIVFGQPFGPLVESEMAGQQVRMGGERGVRLWRDFGDRQRFRLAGLRDIEALFDHLLVLGWVAIGGHFADAQVIVGEDAVAALLLNFVVLAVATPTNYRFFVAPSGERQHPTLAPFALEAFVVDETVDRLQDRFQVFGETKVQVLFARSGMHFENYGEHDVFSFFGMGKLSGEAQRHCR
jgi:hypothetical protein